MNNQDKINTIETTPYSIKFKIPSIPPSVNSLYNVVFSLKKVELKPEIRLWKTQSKMLIPAWKPTYESKTGFLYFKMDVYLPVYNKNGSVRKIDISNMEKACLDTVCEKIGIDDKFVVDTHCRKIESVEEYLRCEIGFVD